MATTMLYMGQFRAAGQTWQRAADWCETAEAAWAEIALRVPAGLEYRVLAVTAEVLVPVGAPTLERLEPATAVVGGPDLVLHVLGTGFDVTSRILWNGAEEPTVFVSATELTTVVKPSTASGPWAIAVGVTGAAGTATFQFTAA